MGDVLQVLNTGTVPESVMPETPPELAFYLAKEGKPVWGDTPTGNLRWSLKQTQCFFDTVLTKTDGDFFSETLLGLPPAPNKTPRKPFTSKASPDAALQQASKTALQACLVSKDGWAVMQGYLNYLAKVFVAPYMQEQVLGQNGGLVVTRSVWSWLEGRPEPILALSLEPGDPRIQFGFLGQDETLEAPGVCEQLSDVENAYTACAPVYAAGDSTKLKYYQKMPSTYHTGKNAPEELGALAKYKGDEVAWGMWPRASVPILGAAKEAQGSVLQYGYSEGEQFPPLNRLLHAVEGVGVASAAEGTAAAAGVDVAGKVTSGAEQLGKELKDTLSMLSAEEEEKDGGERNTDLLIFLSKFVLPLRFRYEAPAAPVQGIQGLLRFVLSPTNFSPKRKDAKSFSMDGPTARAGLLNLTDLQGLPLYLSPPHYTGYPSLQALESVKSTIAYTPTGEAEAKDGSHLDVDPYTGRTLNVAIRMQLSSSTQGAAQVFDVFHPKVHEAELVPLLWMTQAAEVGPQDAATFKTLVEKPLKTVQNIQLATLLAGIVLTAVGLLLLVAGCVSSCLARRAAARTAKETLAKKASLVEVMEDVGVATDMA